VSTDFKSLRSKRFRRIGLSTGLKDFSLVERAKIGANAKKCSFLHFVAFAPIFALPKSEKCLERAENACYAGYNGLVFILSQASSMETLLMAMFADPWTTTVNA